MELEIPKLRQGSYFPCFLEPRKTAEQALVAVIQEAWIKGISTRKIDDLVQTMGLSGHLEEPSCSSLCQEIDKRVKGFLNRLISGEWAYLWLNTAYLKVREGGRVVSVAAIIAVGVNQDGRREILGLGIGPSEAATFWLGFLRGLQQRGLSGVKLVISDAHEGLKAAIAQVFKAAWQRCRVHFMRNMLAYVPKAHHSMVAAAAIRTVFFQENRKSAGEVWRQVADQLRSRWPKLAAAMDEAETDVLAFMDFPRALAQAAFDQPARTPQQGGQAPRQRGRHLPERGQHPAPHRSHPDGAEERRVAAPAPLHDARDHDRPRRRRDQRQAGACPESRLTPNQGST